MRPALITPTRTDSSKSTAPNPLSLKVRVTAVHTGGEILDGERKTVTKLFADITGSMELIEDLEPEEAPCGC
jgi:class 3 adenylate cyclase